MRPHKGMSVVHSPAASFVPRTRFSIGWGWWGQETGSQTKHILVSCPQNPIATKPLLHTAWSLHLLDSWNLLLVPNQQKSKLFPHGELAAHFLLLTIYVCCLALSPHNDSSTLGSIAGIAAAQLRSPNSILEVLESACDRSSQETNKSNEWCTYVLVPVHICLSGCTCVSMSVHTHELCSACVYVCLYICMCVHICVNSRLQCSPPSFGKNFPLVLRC